MSSPFHHTPSSKDDRLGVLAELAILDMPPEPDFDDLVLVATHVCNTPIGLISLIDKDRQWYKAGVGLPDRQTSLDHSLYAHALRQREMLVIPDLTLDARTCGNPLVTGEPFVRFYAGAQLRTREGVTLGTLCVLDTVARPDGLSPIQALSLQTLARQVVSNFELRRAIAQRDRADSDKVRADALAATFAAQNEALLAMQAIIAEAKGDLNTMLRTVVDGVPRAVENCDGAVVALRDAGELVYRAASGSMAPFVDSRLLLSAHLGSGLAVLTGEAQMTTDATKDARIDPSLAKRFAIGSVIIAPLLRHGEAAGMLMVKSSKTEAFTARDVQAVRVLAGTVSGGLADVAEAAALREEQEAIAKLKASEQFNRSVLESSPDCIKVLDLEGRLLFMSEGALCAMEIDDFLTVKDRSWPTFWPDGSQAQSAVDTARVGGVGQFGGYADTFKGRSRCWDVRVTPILGRDGRPERLLAISRDVTDAREAAERIEVALNAGAVLGTWVWDVPNDRFTADSRFARTFSLDAAELATGVPLSAVVTSIHPDDAPQVGKLIDGALAQGGRYSAEYRVRQRDGSWAWIEATGHCDLDDAGQPVRFPGALIDIDRRKRQEGWHLALAELGDRLRDLRDPVEIAFVAARIVGAAAGVDRAGFGTVDAGARTIAIKRDWTAGEGVQSLVGVHRFDDYGTFIADLLDGRTVSIADVAKDHRTSASEDHFRELQIAALVQVPLLVNGCLVAMVFLNSSGLRAWTDDEVAFLRNAADRTWAAIERSRAEADLVRFNETLEAEVAERTRERDRLWDVSENLLVVANYEGRLLRVSNSWTRLLDYSEDRLLSRPYAEIIHPDDFQSVADILQTMRATGKPAMFEDRLIAADGTIRWTAWTLSPEPDSDLILGVGRDITEEKGRRAELEQTQIALRQSQKMEAVGQLTGGLAHDFNNLLTGITGSLDLLQSRLRQGRLNDVDRYVIAAQGAAQRATALTHRLLAFSRQQTLDPKATDANRLVSGLQELIQRTVGPTIAVENIAAGGLWTTLIDPSQLENALLNLCINARDAMPDGGKITIETGNKLLDAHAAREREVPAGQYVTLRVSDTGTGMPPDVIARAFDPFYTTKPIGQGTGLGLSMIYGFARQSGGQVRIDSEVGQGTMVCLYLPRHIGHADEAEVQPELSDAPRAERGETVLVVDDEPTVRMLVTEVLEDLGYTAIEAGDGAAGLKVLQSKVRIDLLVTDVGLPGGMNGRQVADAARVVRPKLKVLFITGYAENAVLSHGHLGPGMHVMAKPFAMEALASRIRHLITSP